MLPKKVQKLFGIQKYELEFPLKAPPYVIADPVFIHKCREIFKLNMFDRISGIINKFKYKGFKYTLNSIGKKIRRKS